MQTGLCLTAREIVPVQHLTAACEGHGFGGTALAVKYTRQDPVRGRACSGHDVHGTVVGTRAE